MKIVTAYENPPIPDRSGDWSAVDDNTYEPGCPVGRGPTEQAALEDLNAQLYEDRDHAPHEPLCPATSNCTICWPEDSADLGAEDIEDEYVDPREEYADQVCIKLRGEL